MSKYSFKNKAGLCSVMVTDHHHRHTHSGAVFLLLDERQHAGEDAGTHDQVSLLLHVRLEDPEHHGQQDAPRLCDAHTRIHTKKLSYIKGIMKSKHTNLLWLY